MRRVNPGGTQDQRLASQHLAHRLLASELAGAAKRLRRQQARWRAGGARDADWRGADLACRLGLLVAWRQLRENHAASDGESRRTASGGRSARIANLGARACRLHLARAESKA